MTLLITFSALVHYWMCILPPNVCSVPEWGSPSCLQATTASDISQELSHTVPQILLWQISTRPWVLVPPWSLMAPWVHVDPPSTHLTPASSEWTQLWVPSGLAGQSMSLVSVLLQWTLSSHICPEPSVKPPVRATAPNQNLMWISSHWDF